MEANFSKDSSWAWTQQRIWSRTATRLKRNIDRARMLTLCLAITTAVFAAAAVQASGGALWAGRSLSAAAAVAAGLGIVTRRQTGTEQVRTWTRARSVSEALKTEVYAYLAGGSDYAHDDRDRRFAERTRGLVSAVADLQRHSLGEITDNKPVPAIHDVESYIRERINGQLEGYYRPKALLYEHRVRRLRLAGDMLGLSAAALTAAAAAFGTSEFSVWVPVVTTVGTSVAAYIAAAGYDHLIVEFLRTAQRLEYLLDSRVHNSIGDAEFIDKSEAAISTENQGWMARWETSQKES
jgi:hypothetical protein